MGSSLSFAKGGCVRADRDRFPHVGASRVAPPRHPTHTTSRNDFFPALDNEEVEVRPYGLVGSGRGGSANDLPPQRRRKGQVNE